MICPSWYIVSETDNATEIERGKYTSEIPRRHYTLILVYARMNSGRSKILGDIHPRNILRIIYDISLRVRALDQDLPSKYLVSWREEGAVARTSGVPRWWNATMFGCWSRGGPLNSVIAVSITAMAAAASAPVTVAAPASAQPRSLHANT